ncbi:Pathogenicity cluster 5 protein d like [Verticillium longisporum]|nr:Pathogenicity cluster 5 protein d like [Verticillium longisporum]
MSRNKAIALALAKQLALIGGDPLLALESGTFVAGELNDRTAAGKSCDSANDPVGCIFTQRLLLLDATPDEIKAAVKDVVPAFKGTGQLKATHIDFAGLPVAAATGAVLADAGSPAGKPATTPPPSSGNAAGNAAGNAGNAADKPPAGAPDADECEAVKPTTSASRSCTVFTTTLPAGAVGTPAPAGGNNVQAGGNNVQAGGNNVQAGGNNIQAFTGTLGGAAPPVIKGTGDRPFSVNGNTFTGAGAALSRSCDIQHNACANAANTGKLTGGVGQCETQNAQCHAANSLGKRSSSRERFLRERRQATPATGNFGSCTDPSIKFAAGLDGRKESAFIPNNLKDFGHGSAQKVGIIAGFICQRLSDSCKAPAAVQASCAQASAAAIAAAQNQAAADAFNGILIGKAAVPPPKATPTPTPAGGAAAAITPAPAAGEDACPPPAPVVVTITKCT